MSTGAIATGHGRMDVFEPHRQPIDDCAAAAKDDI